MLGLGGGYIEEPAAFVNGDNSKGVAAESRAREGSEVQGEGLANAIRRGGDRWGHRFLM